METQSAKAATLSAIHAGMKAAVELSWSFESAQVHLYAEMRGHTRYGPVGILNCPVPKNNRPADGSCGQDVRACSLQQHNGTGSQSYINGTHTKQWRWT